MRTSLTIVCTVLAAIAPLVAAQSIDATARGDARVTDTQQLVLQGALDGSSRGTLHVTLRWDGSPQAAGHWRVSFENQGADGTVVETGSLRGTITGGSIVPGPAEAGTALSNLTLTIQEGTGDHATVAAGSGRMDVRLGREGEPFTASLALTF